MDGTTIGAVQMSHLAVGGELARGQRCGVLGVLEVL
jgi:hypothetical protein